MPQAVEGDAPGGDHAVLLARLPQQVPQRAPVFGGGVDLPAQFADVGHPHHRHRDGAEVGLHGAEVARTPRARCRRGTAARPGRGPAAPDADAAGAAGDVADGHAASSGRCRVSQSMSSGPLAPTWKTVVGEPGDGEIAADAAGLVEQQGVGDRPDALVDVVGGHPLQERRTRRARRPRSGSAGSCRTCATCSRVHCASATRWATRTAPTSRHAPGTPARRCSSAASAALASYQAGRSQPPPSKKYAPSSCWRAWNGLMRRPRRRRAELVRVDDVVDLDEGLRAGRADELGAAWRRPRSGTGRIRGRRSTGRRR